LDKWAKSNGVKYCPNCKRKVQKTIGCDHMTCTKCKYEWCWLCGRNYISGHHGECEAQKLSKKNPPLWKVMVLILAPIEVIFTVPIALCIFIYKARLGTLGSVKFQRFARNHRILAYFWAVLFGIIFSPLFYAMAPIVCTGIICKNIFKKCCGTNIVVFCIVLLTLFCTPFFIITALLGISIASVVGMILLLWKTLIILIRIINPGFLLPNYSYGYN